MKRKEFIKDSAIITLGSFVAANTIISAPTVLTKSRTNIHTARGDLHFIPHIVQDGKGPHLLNWAYATDNNWNTFHSNISADQKGIVISDTEGIEKFGINVRWHVEGFGYIFITADNGGEYYSLPEEGKTDELNLNYELAKSRVYRNRKRLGNYNPSKEVASLLDLSEQLLEDSKRSISKETKFSKLAQSSLYYALVAGEKLELEKANTLITAKGFRSDEHLISKTSNRGGTTCQQRLSAEKTSHNRSGRNSRRK